MTDWQEQISDPAGLGVDHGEGENAAQDGCTCGWAPREACDLHYGDRDYDPERDDFEDYVDTPADYEGDKYLGDPDEGAGPTIPEDWPVQPVAPYQRFVIRRATCGTCGLSWDDGQVTSLTPTPAARCPFEPFHEPEEDEETGLVVTVTGTVGSPGLFDTILRFVGTDEDGGEVIFAVDHRPARDLRDALDEEGPVDVWVEPWQVLRRLPAPITQGPVDAGLNAHLGRLAF